MLWGCWVGWGAGQGLGGSLGSRRVPALPQLSKSTFPTKTPAWRFPAASCPMLLRHVMGSD